MSSEPKRRTAFDEWTGLLACPACLSALRLDEGAVFCTGCGRTYPVVDGIPVLIAERADAKQP